MNRSPDLLANSSSRPQDLILLFSSSLKQRRYHWHIPVVNVPHWGRYDTIKPKVGVDALFRYILPLTSFQGGQSKGIEVSFSYKILSIIRYLLSLNARQYILHVQQYCFHVKGKLKVVLEGFHTRFR